MKLSSAMQRTLTKLSVDEWRSAYDMRESLNTLYALGDRREVISRGHKDPGALQSPNTVIEWRLP